MRKHTIKSSDVWEKEGAKFFRCQCGATNRLGEFISRFVGVYRCGGECHACKAEITIEPLVEKPV